MNKNSTPGLDAVLTERFKQIEKGYTPEHDFKKNHQGELKTAAINLLHPDIHFRMDRVPATWDKEIWWKYCIKAYKDRLKIAAAWIIAELDREEEYTKTLKDE